MGLIEEGQVVERAFRRAIDRVPIFALLPQDQPTVAGRPPGALERDADGIKRAGVGDLAQTGVVLLVAAGPQVGGSGEKRVGQEGQAGQHAFHLAQAGQLAAAGVGDEAGGRIGVAGAVGDESQLVCLGGLADVIGDLAQRLVGVFDGHVFGGVAAGGLAEDAAAQATVGQLVAQPGGGEDRFELPGEGIIAQLEEQEGLRLGGEGEAIDPGQAGVRIGGGQARTAGGGVVGLGGEKGLQGQVGGGAGAGGGGGAGRAGGGGRPGGDQAEARGGSGRERRAGWRGGSDRRLGGRSPPIAAPGRSEGGCI